MRQPPIVPILEIVVYPLKQNHYLYHVISITSNTAAGFGMMWTPMLRFRVRQRSDGMQKQIKMAEAVFLSDYGLGNWNHYVLTYR